MTKAMMWSERLEEAGKDLTCENARERFETACSALDTCYKAKVVERGLSEAVPEFKKCIELLARNQVITEEEKARADQLREIWNLTKHERLLPCKKETARAIDTVGRLCAKFFTKVHDIMVKNVVTATRDQKIQEFISYIRDEDMSQFPVMEGDTVVGTLWDTAVLTTWEEGQGLVLVGDTPVAELMECSILPSVSPNDDIETACARMVRERTDVLLVLHGGKLQGILTKWDLLRRVVAQ